MQIKLTENNSQNNTYTLLSGVLIVNKIAWMDNKSRVKYKFAGKMEKEQNKINDRKRSIINNIVFYFKLIEC